MLGIAHIGFRENEARSQGISFRVLKIPMSNVWKSWMMGDETGFMKSLTAGDHTILGFTALGFGGGVWRRGLAACCAVGVEDGVSLWGYWGLDNYASDIE